MSVVCTPCIYIGAVFFHLFPKIKRGVVAVTSVAPPLRVYRPMLRTDSAVIFVLATNSLKMKQRFFFGFAVVQRLRDEMILK